jgi:predicted enzyme related to lactoylglutathione lyase
MQKRQAYPPGVPCWIDLVQPDFDGLTAFYGGLFGWTFETRTPPDAPFSYAYARLDDAIVAGVGSPAPGETAPSAWTNYVCVESADDTVRAIEANGGAVSSPPMDIPRSGRVALTADPEGATIGLWQPAENRGVEIVNLPGTWNFSELHVADPDGAIAFYGAVFGWVCDRLDFGAGVSAWLWRVRGYGDFLAADDPEIRERLSADQAPDGFADAVAWMEPFTAGSGVHPHWSVTFAVADADAAFTKALALGAEVVTPLVDTDYTRQGVIRDPQGAALTLSEYRPPSVT